MKLIIYILLSAALLSSCNSHREEEFIVKGTGFEELEGKKLYLWRIKDMISPEEFPIDSAVVINGAFEFRGKEDTLHMYYIDESIRFFPERGVNIIDPVAPCQECTARNQTYWELLQSGLPGPETYRFMKENIANALGVFMFDRWTGIEPGDVEELYEKSNEQMRSYFPLNAVKKQLDSTPRLVPGSPFIDFKREDLKGNPIQLSEIADKGNYVCLVFLLNMAEKSYIAHHIKDLSDSYPGLQTIIVSYYNPAPVDKQFEEEMQSKQGVHWIQDDRRYEESVHYKYRIRGPINYRVLISPDGKITETQTIRQDTPFYLEQFETLFAAWKHNYNTDMKARISSHTNAAKELKEYPELLKMGKGILPFLITKLVAKDNFFALTLYDELQDDENLKSPPYSKPEQDRAQETVKKYVEFHLGIKKREFTSDEEKLRAMTDLFQKYGWEDDPDMSEEERVQSLLEADYEITEEFLKMMKDWKPDPE